MTQNQIAFYNAVENVRHNKVTEAETYRSNVARETETHRTNVVYEQETIRSNLARETETHRHNVATESIGWHQAESSRMQAHASQTQAAAAMRNANTNALLAKSTIALNRSNIALNNYRADNVRLDNSYLRNTLNDRVKTQYASRVSAESKASYDTSTWKESAKAANSSNVHSVFLNDSHINTMGDVTSILGNLISGTSKLYTMGGYSK